MAWINSISTRRGVSGGCTPESSVVIHVRRLSNGVYLATSVVGPSLSVEARTPEEARRLVAEVARDLIEAGAAEF